MRQNRRTRGGFTMIEILMVVAIIGILASVVVVSTAESRNQAREKRAAADLRNIRTAVALLESDTGRWPNGCPSDRGGNQEANLNTSAAGIMSVPSIGVIRGVCEWTAEAVAGWKGPYANSVADPWGRNYVFDPDYLICQSGTTRVFRVVQSVGADGQQQYPVASADENDPTDPTAGQPCISEATDDVYLVM